MYYLLYRITHIEYKDQPSLYHIEKRFDIYQPFRSNDYLYTDISFTTKKEAEEYIEYLTNINKN